MDLEKRVEELEKKIAQRQCRGQQIGTRVILKTAREIMTLLEENNMTLFPDETNQIYLMQKDSKQVQCLNDMADSFDVRILKNEPM